MEELTDSQLLKLVGAFICACLLYASALNSLNYSLDGDMDGYNTRNSQITEAIAEVEKITQND